VAAVCGNLQLLEFLHAFNRTCKMSLRIHGKDWGDLIFRSVGDARRAAPKEKDR
jgi:hypothetical protein